MASRMDKWNLFQNFKFPIACWIILIHEVLERFSFYGMKGILSIYLNLYLGFDDDVTTIIYHLFVGLSYLSPIIGAIIADNYLGRFKTVIVIGLIYLLGHILMTLTSIRKNIPGPLIGMCILALGAGGIKSSVAAFGGDQVPEGNDKMIEKYFSVFYTAINLGAFVAQFVTPILRKDISCVDGLCYPLGFGVPAATFLLTYLIFIAGKRTYNIVERSKSVLSKFVRCIFLGISKYFQKNKSEKYESFIDYAYPEYSKEFIDHCKAALKIMIVFAPIPVFWALYDQQGSRWTLQAKYMDGKIGSNYFMKPEQIQAFNALLIIILIPIFDFIIYPLCEKLNLLVKPTSRLVSSYVIAAISFILAGILQIYIIRGQTIDFGAVGSKLLFVNLIPSCQINVTIGSRVAIVNSRDQQMLDVEPGIHRFLIQCKGFNDQWKNVTLSKFKMKNAIIYLNNNTGYPDSIISDMMTSDGRSHIRSLKTDSTLNNSPITIMGVQKNFTIGRNYSTVDAGIYDFNCEVKCKRIEIMPGLLGTLIIDGGNKVLFVKEFEPKLIHMLWQMPQYILITCAEILCSITALSFAYSESPDSMKSLMQAVYLITIFGGNLIVVFVASIGNKITQTMEFFLFAVLVLIAGFINWILIRLFWVSKSKTNDRNLIEPIQ